MKEDKEEVSQEATHRNWLWGMAISYVMDSSETNEIPEFEYIPTKDEVCDGIPTLLEFGEMKNILRLLKQTALWLFMTEMCVKKVVDDVEVVDGTFRFGEFPLILNTEEFNWKQLFLLRMSWICSHMSEKEKDSFLNKFAQDKDDSRFIRICSFGSGKLSNKTQEMVITSALDKHDAPSITSYTKQDLEPYLIGIINRRIKAENRISRLMTNADKCVSKILDIIRIIREEKECQDPKRQQQLLQLETELNQKKSE